jgi:hypothetical protein
MASFYTSMLLGRNRESFHARAGQGHRRRREGDGSGRAQNVAARTPVAARLRSQITGQASSSDI